MYSILGNKPAELQSTLEVII